MRVSADVDERTLREIYLRAFQRVVTQAQPWTVMCSYNKINGVYASQHHWLLTEVLRGEWGFEGLVVSDWGAVSDRVGALRRRPRPHDARSRRRGRPRPGACGGRTGRWIRRSSMSRPAGSAALVLPFRSERRWRFLRRGCPSRARAGGRGARHRAVEERGRPAATRG